MAIFAKIANFTKIASLQGATFGIQFKSPAAGNFSPVSPFSPLHAFLDISEEKRTLDDFRRRQVPELKEFLRIHGLKTTGTKDELTALAFGAEQLSVPVKLTAEEEIIQKKKQYQSLLNVNGEQLPDPFTELKDNWISEETGVEKWPPILQMQIAEFILTAEQGSDLGKRLRSDYKEGKAFSYFDSQWLKEVFYHPISDTHELCLLKS